MIGTKNSECCTYLETIFCPQKFEQLGEVCKIDFLLICAFDDEVQDNAKESKVRFCFANKYIFIFS